MASTRRRAMPCRWLSLRTPRVRISASSAASWLTMKPAVCGGGPTPGRDGGGRFHCAAAGPDGVREQVTPRADDDHGSLANVAGRFIGGKQQWRPGLLARARKELEVYAAATGIYGNRQRTVAAAGGTEQLVG